LKGELNTRQLAERAMCKASLSVGYAAPLLDHGDKVASRGVPHQSLCELPVTLPTMVFEPAARN
jgi:hypothetical protein